MNETIRSYLKRRTRWSYGVAFGSWLLFPLATLSGESARAWVGVAGLVGFGAGILAVNRIKCPRCAVRLGQSIAGTLAVPGLKPQPNFCPYCGVSLDEPRTKPVTDAVHQPFNPIR